MTPDQLLTTTMDQLLVETSTKVRTTLKEVFANLNDRLIIALSTACLDLAVDLQVALLRKNGISGDEAKVPRKMFEDLTDTLWDGYVERYLPTTRTSPPPPLPTWVRS